jgi:hypothetical protein
VRHDAQEDPHREAEIHAVASAVYRDVASELASDVPFDVIHDT